MSKKGKLKKIPKPSGKSVAIFSPAPRRKEQLHFINNEVGIFALFLFKTFFHFKIKIPLSIKNEIRSFFSSLKEALQYSILGFYFSQCYKFLHHPNPTY